MNQNPIEQLNQLMDQAQIDINDSVNTLDKLLLDARFDREFTVDDRMYVIQSLLQYRLSAQDALTLLLQIDQTLRYILGIQPGNTAAMNLDHLTFALGEDDLKEILNALAILTDRLAKIISRHHKTQRVFGIKNKQERRLNPLTKEVKQALLKQKHFLSTLHKCQWQIQKAVKFQAIGPFFNHLAALRGPISQFHQAIMHGIGQAMELYKKVNTGQVFQHQMNELLKKVDHVIHEMPSLYKSRLSYPLAPFANKITTEQLEKRASEKRLGLFF